MIVDGDNSVLSCLAEIGELDLLRRLYGYEIDFEDTFLRLSQTGFRLSAEIVEALRAGQKPPTRDG